MQGSIVRKSSMTRILGRSKMKGTDNKWLRAKIYNALISHVDGASVRILHPTLTMAFRSAMAGSGWDLKRDTQ